jgi:hypothetical protein
MLSKSKFIRGEKCQKSLWLYVHSPELAMIDDSQLAIMNRGTKIGVLAREYFLGGVMAVEGEYPTRVSALRTQELIDQGVETIYEATFIHDDTLVAVDILTRTDRVWKLFECKGTTGVRDYHILDIAVQVYVVAGAGMSLADASVLHLNNQYVRHGSLDVQRLFTSDSVFDQVLKLQDMIPERINLFRMMLDAGEPLIGMGNQCDSPYPCDFKDYCHNLLPDSPAETLEEIIDPPIVHHNLVRKWLDQFGYPLHFLDFETIMPAIPLFDQSRPYQQIPFQYSLHYLSKKSGQLVHSDYLAWPNGDPRPDLIRTLIAATRATGKILVYNATFEKRCLNEMANDFPEYADDLLRIRGRIEDLARVFQSKSFHFPHLGRKYSLKLVLPLLVSDLSYKDLEINNGGDASAMFEQLYTSTDTEHIEKIRENLLKYCHLDTLAMVRIMEVLEVNSQEELG